jgi:hypothetical protein
MSLCSGSTPQLPILFSWLDSTSLLNVIRLTLGSTLLYSPTTVPDILGGSAHKQLAVCGSIPQRARVSVNPQVFGTKRSLGLVSDWKC